MVGGLRPFQGVSDDYQHGLHGQIYMKKITREELPYLTLMVQVNRETDELQVLNDASATWTGRCARSSM